MCPSKIVIARVALRIARADEKQNFLAHAATCSACCVKVNEISRAASVIAGPFCMSNEEILRSTDSSISSEDDEHLRTCERCAQLGFKIVHLAASAVAQAS